MHPAPSIILFTVLSGLGFGLLAFLGLGFPPVTGGVAFAFFTIAYLLALGGLAASAFHLGHPERVRLAFSQWRTSWLSREAWLSAITLVVMAIYGAGTVFFDTALAPLGYLGAALSLTTVFATSMIYAQLKTVPRWNHWTTPALFLAMSLAGGAALSSKTTVAGALLLVAGGVQIAAWVIGDTAFKSRGPTIESATGLGHMGRVRAFEPPHTGTNYLMREMIHQIGRKHARKLRIIGATLGFALPAALLLGFPASHILAVPALISHIAGAVTLRWLFFAEAEHTVGLYYGKR
ncbi:dimethyl sulfoxide reductase anchor subunit family protein [Pseudogemmobacter sp. W21_MBD1_M6]|uniref:dimethyl sulfoxide reductase anchor subunit family protein n=1 Tax=Pseudogemmobacter sp. W21_MBD1_M6 TaxID=3240271 RepID=UPI003F9B1CEC